MFIRTHNEFQWDENLLKFVKQNSLYFLLDVNVNQPLWCARSNLVPFTHHQTLFGGSSLTTQSRLKSRPFGFFPVFRRTKAHQIFCPSTHLSTYNNPTQGSKGGFLAGKTVTTHSANDFTGVRHCHCCIIFCKTLPRPCNGRPMAAMQV